MTAETGFPTAERIGCPKCGARIAFLSGAARCHLCATQFWVVPFAPLLDAAALDVGAGRCANHAGKDAVEACERCGAFVCDVCLTRTGERQLCPACFETLHTRGELETTRTSRLRLDHLSISLAAIAVFLPGCGVFCAPFALVTAIVSLWRGRREKWLRPLPAILALVLSFVAVAVFVALVVM